MYNYQLNDPSDLRTVSFDSKFNFMSETFLLKILAPPKLPPGPGVLDWLFPTADRQSYCSALHWWAASHKNWPCSRINFQSFLSNERKSYFEITYASIVKINESVKEKKELEKIILCDVQNIIYPKSYRPYFKYQVFIYEARKKIYTEAEQY